MTGMKMHSPHDFEMRVSAPMFPATSQEFINLVAHYYRGEIARMAGWRDRIDRTTNWAITCVAAMLSISWSGPAHHHEILLFAMIIVSLLLVIESRRYRFFDVYRRRVRTIERHYYAQVFRPEVDVSSDWTKDLGDDLRLPTFVIGRSEAFCHRLRRNYLWLFMILLAAWILQISRLEFLPGSPDLSRTNLILNASIGPLPGVAVVIVVAGFYLALISAALLRRRPDDDELVLGSVHV
jgi:uncharacterized membrane protein